MSKFRRIRTTVPPKTLAGRRSQPESHAAYLRMSYLAMERKRRQVEVDNLTARLEVLQARLKVIDRDLAKLADQVAKPELFVDADLPDSGPSLSIRY